MYRCNLAMRIGLKNMKEISMVLFLPAKNYDSTNQVYGSLLITIHCNFNNHPKHFKYQISHNFQWNMTNSLIRRKFNKYLTDQLNSKLWGPKATQRETLTVDFGIHICCAIQRKGDENDNVTNIRNGDVTKNFRQKLNGIFSFC